MATDIKQQVAGILAAYASGAPAVTADALRHIWLQYEPKSVAAISPAQQAEQETVGTPVPVLKAIGQAAARPARKDVPGFVPLARLLWDAYGREGRVVALIVLGKMELAAPETIVPLLRTLCRDCVTWEDADRLAMDALEPIVRKDPATWLPAVKTWLGDESMWLRRAGATVVGRLPMKHATYTATCLDLLEPLLPAEETEVRKAVSFAIRLCARGEVGLVADFLSRHVPPDNPAATWVLSDAIRKMTKAFLPSLVPLEPQVAAWAADPTLSTRDRRSVESALRALRRAAQQ